MKQLAGGFSNVAGFSCLGKSIGIKAVGLDFAVLYSNTVCTTAAVYTQNKVVGAPLKVTKQHLADHKAQAIVVNSRVANVATGEQGIANAQKTTELVAAELGLAADEVLVASTGVIGPQLPMDKIAAGCQGVKQQLTPDGAFAEAIMTTDTVKKEVCVQADGFTIAGAAKGSGMIEPNMATMLAFLATDAALAPDQLQAALKTSVDQSFNMMSIDTDTSTSDMVIVMANGQAGEVDAAAFQQALDEVCLALTKMIATDGEGATKLIIGEVTGAASNGDAKKVAKSLINSPLIKTAVYGNDPNWGRIMMAVGKSGADTLEEATIKAWINHELIVENGMAAADYDANQLTDILASNTEITITVDLGVGKEAATAYGCDMTEEYIKINAEYTT